MKLATKKRHKKRTVASLEVFAKRDIGILLVVGGSTQSV
jgi:hypothetical protein